MGYARSKRTTSRRGRTRPNRRFSRPSAPRIAPEFKTNHLSISGNHNVGQVLSTSAGTATNGSYGHRIDPIIVQGSDNVQRIGNWVTLKSLFIDMQFAAQSNATLSNRLIVEVWMKRSEPLREPLSITEPDSDTITAYIFEHNRLLKPLSSGVTNQANQLIDIGSSKNERHSKEFTCLSRKLVVLPPRQLTPEILQSANGADEYVDTDRRMVRCQFYINKLAKLNFNNYDYPGTTIINRACNCGIYLTVRADQGNSDSATAIFDNSSNSSIFVKRPLTGAEFNYYVKTKYYDN